MQLTGKNNGGIASSAFLLARECQNLHNDNEHATCVGTQTSKVPTRVTLLFIPYTVLMVCNSLSDREVDSRPVSDRQYWTCLGWTRPTRA